MTSIAELTEQYPQAADKIQDMIVVAANICDEMDIFVGMLHDTI